MTEPKRRQGQRGATPKPICPKCGEILKRNYTREVINGKQQYVASGWICPSSTCDYIVKDLVELENNDERTENSTDKAEKIKKLTVEFVKKHEELNRLAEQINELEKE
jgi:hypothetical protein